MAISKDKMTASIQVELNMQIPSKEWDEFRAIVEPLAKVKFAEVCIGDKLVWSREQ